MIAVVQRVTAASVAVESTGYHEAIGLGLCVLLGVEEGDSTRDAEWMAGKLARLRIFRDDQDKMNRSVLDVKGEILLVSQFTLAGDCSRGNRPSFIHAAAPELGERLYEEVGRVLAEDHDLTVRTGQFGAMMSISLVNDGPVTILVQTKPQHDS